MSSSRTARSPADRTSADAVIRHRLPVQPQCVGYLSLTRLGEAIVSFSIILTITLDPQPPHDIPKSYDSMQTTKLPPVSSFAIIREALI